MKEPLLDKLDRKFGRYALRNLMLIIIIGTGLVWLLEMIVERNTDTSILSYIVFDKAAIFRGEVWRIITFLFIPDSSSILSLALGLYLDWWIATALENEWGSLRFDLFYACGWLGAVLSGLLTGYATNSYIHLSLFLAFAALYPNFTLYLFFVIPIKMKWLAILDGVILLLNFIFVGWSARIALLMSLLNIVLFFGGNAVQAWKRRRRRKKWQKEAKRQDDDYPFDL